MAAPVGQLTASVPAWLPGQQFTVQAVVTDPDKHPAVFRLNGQDMQGNPITLDLVLPSGEQFTVDAFTCDVPGAVITPDPTLPLTWRVTIPA